MNGQNPVSLGGGKSTLLLQEETIFHIAAMYDNSWMVNMLREEFNADMMVTDRNVSHSVCSFFQK